jgi:hypothetical protein
MLTCSDQGVDSDVVSVFALKPLVSNNKTQPNGKHLPSRTETQAILVAEGRRSRQRIVFLSVSSC